LSPMTIAPPIMSECPFRYLVEMQHDIEAEFQRPLPTAWRTCCRPRQDAVCPCDLRHHGRSTSLSNGLLGDSTQIIRVFGRSTATQGAARSLMSTNVNSGPPVPTHTFEQPVRCRRRGHQAARRGFRTGAHRARGGRCEPRANTVPAAAFGVGDAALEAMRVGLCRPPPYS
jgi:hypothetical protein